MDKQTVCEDNRCSGRQALGDDIEGQTIEINDSVQTDKQVEFLDGSCSGQVLPEDQLEHQEDLIEQFKCPNCTRYMMLPIIQCINGHCVCNSCFGRMPFCTICRAEKTEIRCIPLEKLHSQLTFPCMYAHEGCAFRGLGEVMPDHQHNCTFASLPCPFRFKHDCLWEGSRPDMMVHCKECHSTGMFWESKVKLIAANFKEIRKSLTVVVLNVHDNMFRCLWDLDVSSHLMRLSVYCLGMPRGSAKFEFEVSYMNEDAKTKTMGLRAPCHYMEDVSEKFLACKYYLLEHREMKKWCNQEGRLHYILNIIKTR